jgi:hypothetical protein
MNDNGPITEIDHMVAESVVLKLSSLVALLLGVAVLLALCASPALAQTGAVKFFGGPGTEGGEFTHVGAMEVNQDGAGGAAPGDLYVIDENRIQQFSAAGDFIRAFGLGVGGPGVDICEIAASCLQGTASGAAGAIGESIDLAIDQTTGTIYVTDQQNHRIDVFSATGSFEGAFGWAVKATGTAQELQFCTAETGCQTGSFGSGAGQFRGGAPIPDFITPDSHDHLAVSPLNERVIVADAGNRRIDEFVPAISGGKVVGISFLRGYGWGAATGADEFQTCTTTCHEPPCVGTCHEPGSPNIEGSQPGNFGGGYPQGIAVSTNGTIYVLDRYNTPQFNSVSRIQRFDSDGTPLEPLGEGDEGIGVEDLRINLTTSELIGKDAGSVSGFNLEGALITHYLKSEGIGQTGLAQGEATGTTYVGIQSPESGVITLGEIVAPSVSISPVTSHTGTTAILEGHVNPNGLFATYQFEYSTDGTHWTVLPASEESLPADNIEHMVSQEVTGLEGLTQYQVRLSATKLFNSGTGQAETSFETAPAPASVSGQPNASAISADAATLEGKVNPQGEATRYHFECVDATDFGQTGYSTAVKVPAADAEVAAAKESVAISQQIIGLAPSTSYHCRLAVSNHTGGAVSGEFIFTTFSVQSEGLPDGRVYEQASPVEKNGSDATGEEYLLKASTEGDAVTYFMTAGGGGTGGGGQGFPTYVARRGPESWVQHPFLPTSTLGELAATNGWSEDLKRDYVLTWNSGTKATFYEQDLDSGVVTEIATGLEPHTGAVYAGESADGTRILFESTTALLPEAREGESNLYVWNSQAKSLILASVLPDGSSSPGGAFAGPYDWPELEPKRGGAADESYTQMMHVLSSNGEEAFFTTGNVNQVYVRIGIGNPDETTAQISASQKTNGSGAGGRDPKGPQKAAFMTATPDGSYAFFTSREELTNDATTGTADQGNDLYRYDVSSGELIDVSVDPGDPNGAEVQGVLGASADGSYVYFAANGVLGDPGNGASPGDCKSSPVVGWGGNGTCNLYVWHSGLISFVSSIGSQVSTGGLNWIPATTVGSSTQSINPAHVSLDGKKLAFTSTMALTSYDNQELTELYRYDTESGLACVSCSPTREEAKHPASVQGIQTGVKPVAPNAFQIRNMTSDGNRLYFVTGEKLVAADVNGVQDVYEWEANGSGTCNSEAQNGGCLYLISTGQSSSPSYFDDASASGNDVFFFTRQSLVGQDKDNLVDVYDARVAGGLPGQGQSSPALCEGEQCRAAAATAQGAAAAGTASFSGPGNPTKLPPKKHHKKKHHKKNHHKKKHHKKKSAKNSGRHHTSKSRSK